ncbi:hypothetical protein Tco_0846011 [Tanacetum coccineum]
MASHRLNPLYAIKECSTCGSLYTRECCSIRSFEDKILSSPCCAKCGTPVDGPYCRGCALLRKEFKEDLLKYCVENGIFQDSQDTFESSNDNTNVVNAPREPFVVNQDPSVKFSQEPPQIDHYCPHYDYQCQPINETYYEPNSSYDSSGFDQPHPPQNSVDHQGILQVLNKMEEKFEEIIRDRRKKIEDMSIKEMMHEQQLVDREIKEITNDLGIRRFRGEEINEEYERICEITIRKLKQDFNIWGSKVRKKEKAYEDEKYAAACRYMLYVTCDDEVDYIPSGDIIARNSTSEAITPDLPIQEPDNSLDMGDEHLDTIPATESDEVIKSSIENLVPIPSEFEGIFDDTCDVPNCDNNRINIESELVESLSNRNTSSVHSSKIGPILKEFAGELAHIAPIPPGIVEADFDPNDDTSSDDDSYEDIEYVDATPPNSELVSLEEVEDVILHDKLSNVYLLISKIEALNDNPTLSSFSNFDNSFSNHTEETRSGNTTTHVNYSLPEYDSFLFEIEPDQEGLISVDNSNNTLLELSEFKSFHFDLSFPRPPREPPDVEICLHFEPDVSVIDNFNELNYDKRGSEINFSEDDDSFTFTIQTFLPFLTYLEVSPLSCSTGNEDLIFDPGIITFHFLKTLAFLWKFLSSIFALPKEE